MNAFLNGFITMACLANGLFFLRFWKNTGDRLFAMFAVSFWLLAFDQIVISVLRTSQVASPAQYLARLAAFVVLIAAIVEKNRKKPYRP